jgi:hypothetical protein
VVRSLDLDSYRPRRRILPLHCPLLDATAPAYPILVRCGAIRPGCRTLPDFSFVNSFLAIHSAADLPNPVHALSERIGRNRSQDGPGGVHGRDRRRYRGRWTGRSRPASSCRTLRKLRCPIGMRSRFCRCSGIIPSFPSLDDLIAVGEVGSTHFASRPYRARRINAKQKSRVRD